jgi:hypothetical protein
MEIKVGCVAICHKKRVAVVTKCTSSGIWKGIGFDGKPWQSQDPAWMADNVAEVIGNLHKYKGL